MAPKKSLGLYGNAVYTREVWHAVVETEEYLTDARRAGLSEDERDGIVLYLAAHPDAGTPIPGTGGARKVRFAGRGKGKSGGYRTITFYTGHAFPVFLLALIDKGDRVDLSPKERAALKKELAGIVDAYNTGGERRHGATRNKAH